MIKKAIEIEETLYKYCISISYMEDFKGKHRAKIILNVHSGYANGEEEILYNLTIQKINGKTIDITDFHYLSYISISMKKGKTISDLVAYFISKLIKYDYYINDDLLHTIENRLIEITNIYYMTSVKLKEFVEDIIVNSNEAYRELYLKPYLVNIRPSTCIITSYFSFNKRLLYNALKTIAKDYDILIPFNYIKQSKIAMNGFAGYNILEDDLFKDEIEKYIKDTNVIEIKIKRVVHTN